MDWLLDPGAGTATGTIEGLLTEHLRCTGRGDVDMARAAAIAGGAVKAASAESDSCPLWVQLDWTAPPPVLTVHRLGATAGGALSRAGIAGNAFVEPHHRELLLSLTVASGEPVALPVVGGPDAPVEAGGAPRMELSLTLPRQTSSVPVVRHLAGQTLRAFGVRDAHIDDVQLAISEACANVIEHALDTHTYDVRIELASDQCAITVVDQGEGFDPSALPARAAVFDEGGRGIQLMRALVDNLAFEDQPRAGAIVHMVKELDYDRSHPLHMPSA